MTYPIGESRDRGSVPRKHQEEEGDTTEVKSKGNEKDLDESGEESEYRRRSVIAVDTVCRSSRGGGSGSWNPVDGSGSQVKFWIPLRGSDSTVTG